ncbi:MAG: response regulator [Candidatus Omnitrophica bacterium]|nr:response regulator [Candidatus Omnitrophota bacterium]
MWNILIAEDDPADAEKLIKGLSSIAQCTVAKDGSETIAVYKSAQAKKINFDFILLDVQIPRVNGFDILKTIRKLEESNRAVSSHESKIIMITTYKDSLMENYNMGWDDFMSKPVDITILINRLKELQLKKETI